MALTKITSEIISSGAINATHIASGAINSGHVSGLTTANITEGSNLYFTNARARSSISVTGGALSYDSSTGVLQLTTSTIRSQISSNDTGGDGSLSYNSTSGVITYTGPSATEVRAHLSAGTGVTYSGGQFSIGQSVGTSDDVTFNNINVAGDVNVTGNLNTVNVTDLDVTDKTITLGSGQTESASGNSGIIVDGSGASILWDESNTEWDFNAAIRSTDNVRTTGLQLFEGSTQTGGIFKEKNITGSGTDNDTTIFSETGDGINFMVNGSVTKVLVINSSGKVGIGYDTPTHDLHVHDSSTGAGSTYIRVSREVDSSAVNRKAGIILGTRAANLGSTWRIESDSSSGYSDNARLQFIHNGGGTDANRMTLRHNGRLGIGTESPITLVHANHGNIALGFDAGFWASANPSDYTTGRGAGITMQNADVYTGGIYGIRQAGGWDGALVFYTHTNASGNTFGTTFTEKMRIGHDGAVGIGTSSPSSKLHISDASSPEIRLEDSDATSTFNITAFQNAGGALNFNTRQSNGTFVSTDYQIFKNVAGANIHKWFIGNSEKLRLDASGRLGIGESSPTHKLHVLGTSNDTIDETKGTMKVQASGGNGMIFGTIASSPYTSYIQSGYVVDTSIAQYNLALNPIGGNVGIGTTSPTADLSVGSTSTSSGDVHLRTTKTAFSITPSNTAAGGILLDLGWVSGGQGPMKFGINGTEKARIDSSGNIGIGTSPNGRLQFDNGLDTRKIVLYEGANNDYQFYGFGIEGSTLVYSTFANSDDHVFFSGASASSRNELMRIKGNGNVGINDSTPSHKLDVNGVIGIKSNAVIDSDGTSHYFKTPAGGVMYFYHGTGGVAYIHSSGLHPFTDNALDLGTTTKRWRNVYTTDLHLSNEGKPEGNEVDGTTGNWTIQEGEEHLYIINNKSGKKYRFALEEIE